MWDFKFFLLNLWHVEYCFKYSCWWLFLKVGVKQDYDPPPPFLFATVYSDSWSIVRWKKSWVRIWKKLQFFFQPQALAVTANKIIASRTIT